MSVTKEVVLSTASLCRLDLSVHPARPEPETPEEHIARLASELDAIVGYMDIINKADTEGVEPLFSPLTEHVPPPRPDVAEQLLSAEEILANAPKKHQTFFAVPPVI